MECLGVDPHVYGQLIFDKDAMIIQRRKYRLFKGWCWNT